MQYMLSELFNGKESPMITKLKNLETIDIIPIVHILSLFLAIYVSVIHITNKWNMC